MNLLIVLLAALVAFAVTWKVLTIRDKTMRYRRALEENERWLKEI